MGERGGAAKERSTGVNDETFELDLNIRILLLLVSVSLIVL